jgi:predicted small secreted protein
MKKHIGWILLAAIALAGCETVKGTGRDLQNLGGGIQTAFSSH